MPYIDRQKNEYMKILTKLKKKYSTLILKVSHDEDNVTAVNNDGNKTTSVFNDDEDETVYEKLEKEEIGATSNESFNELKQLRDILVELCHKVYEIISDDTLAVEPDHIKELKEYVDDILLWTHVKEKISMSEYKQKIEELNKVCDDIVSKYDDQTLFKSENGHVVSKRYELEQLCFALMSSILSNMLSLQISDIEQLKEVVESTLDWLIDVDVLNKKAELEGGKYIIEEDEYQNKMDTINNLCTKMYNSMISVNVNDKFEDINIIPQTGTNLTNQKGTTISQLRDNK